MNIREYQTVALQKIDSGWNQFDKQLLAAATGSGKTIISAFITKEWIGRGKRVLFLAHREELLLQTLDKFSKACGIIPQLEKAENRASLTAQVVVGSIQTFISRMERWPENHFDLIIVDECHRSISDSYQQVLKRFDKHAKVLGITATPDRGDKRELGEYFQNIADEISLLSLIEKGFLSPVTIQAAPLKIDLSGVKQTAGDFDANDLDCVLVPYFDQIVDAIKHYAPNRKTLVFLPLIATSKSFVEMCVSKDVRARHIDGKSEDRREILASFARREFDLLSNSMLLTEGYDDPEVDCIVNLRPTRSRPLYAQIVGRGTRIFPPTKKNLLILDFLFTHERHDLIRPAHLIASSEEEAEAMMEEAQEREKQGRGDEIDLIELQASCRSERERKLLEELERKSKRSAKFISAEEFALKRHKLDIAEFQPTMQWHKDPISDKQKEWIEKAGVDPETVKGKGQASQILDVFFGERNSEPASYKVKHLMRQSGWRSADNKRGPDQATAGDAREFFAKKNAAAKPPSPKSQNETLPF